MIKNKEWAEQLIGGKNGPRAIIANAIMAFLNAPEWADILWYDAFHQRTTLRGTPPWATTSVPVEEPWTDQHDRLAACWLQHKGIHVSPAVAGQAAETVARDRPFHPVINYLVELEWDRTPRIDTWAITYLGVDDSTYVRAVAPRFLTAAVARVLDPGCKSDCALILEGPQGILKSTALRTMFSPWFTDDVADLGSKDAALQISGAWCVELAELDSISRADVSKIKAFMSRQMDRFRPPYGARVVEQKRQCVFAGTTNGNEYLRDETGGRRFWPMGCMAINIPGITNVRDQLWAEARVRHDQGKPWWLDTEALSRAAAGEQAARLVRDPWQDEIGEFIKGRSSVSGGEVLKHLGIPLADRDQRAANRVGACLRVLGWENKSIRLPTGEKARRYRPAQQRYTYDPGTVKGSAHAPAGNG